MNKVFVMLNKVFAMLKRVFAAIANHWKVAAVVLAAFLAAIAFAFVLRKYFATQAAISIGVIGALILLSLWLIPKWQVRSLAGKVDGEQDEFTREKDRIASENEARKTLSQIFGGLALLVGWYFTYQSLEVTRRNEAETEKFSLETLRIAQEGQITDRFTKAIAQLGDQKLEVRLGGIYALERIAKDSPIKDNWTIMEVLTAYVREHVKLVKVPDYRKTPGDVLALAIPERPATDIQTILTVIGRRSPAQHKEEKYRLDLMHAELAGSDLQRADLSGAILIESDLTRSGAWSADFSNANLDYVSFVFATLEDSTFTNANLTGAQFRYAICKRAKLRGAHLTAADLRNADFQGADFRDADLSNANLDWVDFTDADLSGADLTDAKIRPITLEIAKGDAKTKLPRGMKRPESWH